jgi:hypothetical protein
MRTTDREYVATACQVLRLSSKSHWDVPIDIQLAPAVAKRVHMLLHHPTPPAFDGPEGRNLLRNHDEIRLFADFVGCTKCPPPSTAASKTTTSSSSSSSSTGGGSGSSSTGGGSGSSKGSYGSGFCGRSHAVGVVCSAASKAWMWLQAKLGTHIQLQPQLKDDAAGYLYDDAGQRGGLAPGGWMGVQQWHC